MRLIFPSNLSSSKSRQSVGTSVLCRPMMLNLLDTL